MCGWVVTGGFIEDVFPLKCFEGREIRNPTMFKESHQDADAGELRSSPRRGHRAAGVERLQLGAEPPGECPSGHPGRTLSRETGCGSKLKSQCYAGFSLRFHLPRCLVGTSFRATANFDRPERFGVFFYWNPRVPCPH